jgi:hypothetical protein
MTLGPVPHQAAGRHETSGTRSLEGGGGFVRRRSGPGAKAYRAAAAAGSTVTDKAKRLDAANQERAEAAVRWEDDANTADETGRPVDQSRAGHDDRALDAADRKIKKIEAEP